jgi:3'(2'), 5'-bisphosphate nucleotidase
MHRSRLEMLLKALPATARRAGVAIMEVYATDFAVRGKADESPVTEADELAEQIILADLAVLAPDIPVISEEAYSRAGVSPVSTIDASSVSISAASTFWLVDPLDGTREFVRKNGEFTVNIALIEKGVPILGVVYAPALDALYVGAEGIGAFCGEGAARRRINVHPRSPQGLTVLASRSHGDEAALQSYLSQRGDAVASIERSGSSLKLCLLAAGQGDLYPRLGRTMEWDIAAGHAVLSAAGGRVEDLAGNPLGYGKPGFDNPHFVAIGHAT